MPSRARDTMNQATSCAGSATRRSSKSIAAAVDEDGLRRRPWHLLLEQDVKRVQIGQRYGNRELRGRTESGLDDRLHRDEDVRAVDIVDLPDHASRSVARLHGNRERAAT